MQFAAKEWRPKEQPQEAKLSNLRKTVIFIVAEVIRGDVIVVFTTCN